MVARQRGAGARRPAEAFQQQIEKIGFKLQFREVPHATMLSKFCAGARRRTVAICPNLGWGKDFFDSQSMLDPLFNGAEHRPRRQRRTRPQVERPEAQREDATRPSSSTDPTQRAKAWARDRQGRSRARRYVVPWLWDNQVGLHVEEREGRPVARSTRRLGPHVQLAQVRIDRADDQRRGPAAAAAGQRAAARARTMVRYIVRRLLWVIVLLFLVSFITFIIFYLLPSADPAPLRAGRQPNPQLVEQIRHNLGLDKPWYQQYFDYMKALVSTSTSATATRTTSPVRTLIFVVSRRRSRSRSEPR